jgi:hypothetical protein
MLALPRRAERLPYRSRRGVGLRRRFRTGTMPRCSEKAKKKPPPLMRERKRDYAGACGQIHRAQSYRSPACKSTDLADFSRKLCTRGSTPAGASSGTGLEGATLPGRVHCRQGRTGGATSDYVVFRAQPSEGGTSEASSAKTARPSARRHGTRGRTAARIRACSRQTNCCYSCRNRDLRHGQSPPARVAGRRNASQSSTAAHWQIRPYVHFPNVCPATRAFLTSFARPFIENDVLHH